MGGGAANPNGPPLNPNWAQLQQKLKSGCQSRLALHDSVNTKTPPSTLENRKERPGPEPTATSLASPLPSAILTPTSIDCSSSDALAMDCEMVGVSLQGNKNTFGRVTLVLVTPHL